MLEILPPQLGYSRDFVLFNEPLPKLVGHDIDRHHGEECEIDPVDEAASASRKWLAIATLGVLVVLALVMKGKRNKIYSRF